MQATILQQIISNRRQRLKDLAEPSEQQEPSQRSMYKAIRESDSGVIFECKAKSPSRGRLSHDYQPERIAKGYSDFAAGISVLTEPDYFDGDYAHLLAVRDAVNNPILSKDFVIDRKQILLARECGADCILLMLSVLSDAQWSEFQALADQLALDTLTEVHNEQELQRAIDLGARIIGINNRDLHSLTTDLDVTRRLAPLVPEDRLLISESGIAGYQQMRSLAPLVDGFLIGTSMMQSASLPQALRKLTYSEVKVCGLTRLEDAQLAFQEGACWGGLIFVAGTPRCVTADAVARWIKECPLPLVGVFRDQDLDEVITLAEQLELAAVQLHGCESEDYVTSLKGRLADQCQVWKTINASDSDPAYPSSGDVGAIIEQWLALGVDRILVDKPKQGSHTLELGELIADERIFIAGGLGADNALLTATNRNAGIDLCSALEASPGIKSSNKVKQFFNQIKVKTRHE